MANHPREEPPPSRWGRSHTGVYFYLVHTKERNSYGKRLYRCRYVEGVTGGWWTLDALNEGGVRWLKRKPSCFSGDRSKT